MIGKTFWIDAVVSFGAGVTIWMLVASVLLLNLRLSQSSLSPGIQRCTSLLVGALGLLSLASTVLVFSSSKGLRTDGTDIFMTVALGIFFALTVGVVYALRRRLDGVPD
jgi:hypothetical protein